MKRNLCLVFVVALLTVLAAGCEQQGPAERAGEKVDETVEETGEQIEEGGEEIREETQN